jgi:hypothetical protein
LSAVQRRNRSFRTTQKSRADLHPARAQGESRRDPPTVCNTTCGDYRDAHGIDDLRNQRHGANHTGARKTAKAPPMSTGFKSLRDDDVRAV